ncbi:MAG: hypothetical protein K8T26_11095 [Lentisphaerae bacterium]|nr:hypothetical protein [Lentisphaerota bacterium]
MSHDVHVANTDDLALRRAAAAVNADVAVRDLRHAADIEASEDLYEHGCRCERCDLLCSILDDSGAGARVQWWASRTTACHDADEDWSDCRRTDTVAVIMRRICVLMRTWKTPAGVMLCVRYDDRFVFADATVIGSGDGEAGSWIDAIGAAHVVHVSGPAPIESRACRDAHDYDDWLHSHAAEIEASELAADRETEAARGEMTNQTRPAGDASR